MVEDDNYSNIRSGKPVLSRGYRLSPRHMVSGAKVSHCSMKTNRVRRAKWRSKNTIEVSMRLGGNLPRPAFNNVNIFPIMIHILI